MPTQQDMSSRLAASVGLRVVLSTLRLASTRNCVPQLAANWPPALGSCRGARLSLSFLRLASSCSSKQCHVEAFASLKS